MKQLLNSQKTEFIMEAHNGLSAKIAEEAGFHGLWGSGLSISAALGVRDNNEASWTQVLEVVEFMSDATTIPILLDGDTGYGNFNSMRRLVNKLEQRDIGGVCIEDKLFPKTNSFIGGESQPLANIDEFCGKLKAGKDAQHDDDFCIVARTEAFISGWGLEEALKRAEAYRQAGADAILVHSKKSTPIDIEFFMREWNNRHPIVIVPTKYYSTPTSRFRDLKISMIIWANHSMRGAVAAMQKIVQQIYREESLTEIEDKISSVSEIFRLQGNDELKQAEKFYLPKNEKNVKAIILAASQGKQLGALTKDKPKTLLEIHGQPLLHRLTSHFNEIGIKSICVVRGFGKELVQGTNFETIDNDEYNSTRDLYSLYLAREKLHGNSIIVYGDSLFRKYLLRDLLTINSDFITVIDAQLPQDNKLRDFAKCNKPYTNDFFNMNVQLISINTSTSYKDQQGEWAGIFYMSEKGTEKVRAILENDFTDEELRTLSMVDLINKLATKEIITVIYTKGGWLDIDDVYDIERANQFYV